MSEAEKLRRGRVDAWLGRGGVVLAASERAARATASGFDAARRAEGRRAWATPAIFGWESWVRERWAERNSKGRVLLNASQERVLWARVIRESQFSGQVENPGRLADAAMRATRLLADFAPDRLRVTARLGWAEDAAIYSAWLTDFDARCRRDGLVSGDRLVLELTRGLATIPEERAPLLLVGFDRLLETQRALLDTWGGWEQDKLGERAARADYATATDSARELGACVGWLRRSLAINPHARLMVVTTGLQERRGEVERALMEMYAEFEFSLGMPLGRVGLIRSALLVLRWLRGPLTEAEVDWLIGSGLAADSDEQGMALAEAMRKLRRRGRERPEWGLVEFLAEVGSGFGQQGLKPLDFIGSLGPAEAVPLLQSISFSSSSSSSQYPALMGLREAATLLQNVTSGERRRTPMEWVLVTGELLAAAGWPGHRALGSVAYQAEKRWQKVLEECGSLGFDGSRMEWGEWLAAVGEAVAGTIFAEESGDAPIVVTEPLAAAGQVADGIWFLGAGEEEWPGRGQANPLLPLGLQRETGMPHASAQVDWEVARQATDRLLGSADEVIFSYARRGTEGEKRASRLVTELLGAPLALAEEVREAELTLAETFADGSRVSFAGAGIGGGARALSRQSVCPFQAFGYTRLGAEQWEFAELGLNARQRGQLLHSVMKRVWAGRQQGAIGTLEDLRGISDLPGFAEGFVARVMRESFAGTGRDTIPARFPERYLQLEAERLTRLVAEWLEYERRRRPFRVESVEVPGEVTVAGLQLQVRMDRVDVLEGGSRLVMDYKTGGDGPRVWAGERPENVQLPLYATFAVLDELEGLVFARLKPEKTEFAGRVRDAKRSLREDLSGSTALVKNPLTDEQLEAWRDLIEQLGRDFVAGKAEVDPVDPEKSCKRCELHAVCRIAENTSLEALIAGEDDGIGEDAGE